MTSLRGSVRRAFLSGTALVSVAAAGAAGAQNSDLEQARAALAQAAAARAEAQRALDAADLAIKAAQAAIGAVEGRGTAGAQGDPPAPTPGKVNNARLDVIGQTRCLANATSAEAIARKPNRYVLECLELDAFTKYDVGSLNAQIGFGTGNDTAEVFPSYSFYWRKPVEANASAFSFSRLQLKGGLVVPLDKQGGTTAAFANLTQAEPFKQLGFGLGFEYGFNGRAKVADMTAVAQKMLAAAQRDCMAERTATTLQLAGGGMAETQLAADPDFDPNVMPCVGKNLNTWMKSNQTRQNKYFSAIDADLWGKKPKSELFVGFEYRRFPRSQTYLPLVDPAGLGTPLVSAPVFTVVDGQPIATLDKKNLINFASSIFSAKAYAGGINGEIGWGGSISYRRLIEFPKDVVDQTICQPGATPIPRCITSYIGAPYVSEGWVVGGRLAAKLPRFAFLPGGGVEIRLSYATDLKQLGVDVPLYLLSDDKGTALGGVRFGCITDGKTDKDFVIKKGECKISAFIGTKFELRGAP
jgi:hypothetical protein